MKHLIWSVLQKLPTAEYSQSAIFAKSFILDVLMGSEYLSDYLEVFAIIMN